MSKEDLINILTSSHNLLIDVMNNIASQNFNGQDLIKLSRCVLDLRGLVTELNRGEEVPTQEE